MIKNVYVRTRPGDTSKITDSLLIAVGDVIRASGLDVIRNTDDMNDETLVLALGGDGTMLSAIKLAFTTGAFVTGFNYGNLGYLVPDSASTNNVLIAKLKELLYDVMNPNEVHEYKITDYNLPMLTMRNRSGKVQAVNEFNFVPATEGAAVDFTVTIGKEQSTFQTKSSGMVVSTPYGSTGLALSAGGSILSPNSGVLEVVPMLACTLTSRPIIVPNTDTITVSSDSKIKIFADGQLVDDDGLTEVVINCKKREINIVQPKDWDFFENLKNKMKWYT